MVLPVLACGLFAGLPQIYPKQMPVSKELVKRTLAIVVMRQHDNLPDALGNQTVNVREFDEEVPGCIGILEAKLAQNLPRDVQDFGHSCVLLIVGAPLAGANGRRAYAGNLGEASLGEPLGLAQALQSLPWRRRQGGAVRCFEGSAKNQTRTCRAW